MAQTAAATSVSTAKQPDPSPTTAPGAVPGASLVRCRRCKRQYELPDALPPRAASSADTADRAPATSNTIASLPPRPLLAACPHCGAAPVPLWRRIARHNGVAAILAVAALVTLVIADVMPFISMSKLGEDRVFSLIGGILELFDRGNWFIGAILLVFSVIFPFAKLVALLAATSGLTRLSPSSRRRLHHLAVLTGKYSLLDLLVVAIMIVLVKFDGIAEVHALPGTILFGAAILLSIGSGLFVDLRDPAGQAGDDVVEEHA